MTIDILDLYRQNIKYLSEKYNKAALNKKEFAGEMGVSISTLDNYISKNEGIPNYIKLGNQERGKIAFPIAEVAKFLSSTIVTSHNSLSQTIPLQSEQLHKKQEASHEKPQ